MILVVQMLIMQILATVYPSGSGKLCMGFQNYIVLKFDFSDIIYMLGSRSGAGHAGVHGPSYILSRLSIDFKCLKIELHEFG